MIYAFVIFFFTILSSIMLFVGLPGSFLLLIIVFLSSLLEGFKSIGFLTLILFLVLVLLGELFEYFSGLYETSRRGASKEGMFGAVAGGILGAIILTGLMPVIGTIIGAFLGSFVGAFSLEYINKKDFSQAAYTGYGALIGRVKAVSLKFLFLTLISIISIVNFLIG